MSLQKIEHTILVNSIPFKVVTVSNSSTTPCAIDTATKKLCFNVTGPSSTTGFCNIVFPKQLLGGPYQVTLDGSTLNHTVNENATHTSLYLNYDHSAQRIEIIGVTAVPEFPSIVVQVLVFFITGFCVLSARRRLLQS